MTDNAPYHTVFLRAVLLQRQAKVYMPQVFFFSFRAFFRIPEQRKPVRFVAMLKPLQLGRSRPDAHPMLDAWNARLSSSFQGRRYLRGRQATARCDWTAWITRHIPVLAPAGWSDKPTRNLRRQTETPARRGKDSVLRSFSSGTGLGRHLFSRNTPARQKPLPSSDRQRGERDPIACLAACPHAGLAPYL